MPRNQAQFSEIPFTRFQQPKQIGEAVDKLALEAFKFDQMHSISKPIKGGKRGDYYSQEDYYANTKEQSGSWFGRGAEVLGLQGKVKPRVFRDLLDGLSPDGQRRLVQNALSPSRQSGWDLTFNAPKSVSTAWATAPGYIWRGFEQAHDQAVKRTLAYLEQVAGCSRCGKGGTMVEQASLVFALFAHGTSRALDPHLHTHAVLVNLGCRGDGSIGTVMSKPIFRLKMVAGVLYEVLLATALREQMGLTIEPDKVGFHIAGVPRDLCRHYSKRRQQVEDEMKRLGHVGTIAAQYAALATRQKKTHVPRSELLARWRQEAQAFGWNEQEVIKLVSGCRMQKTHPGGFEARVREVVSAIPPERRTPGRVIRSVGQLAIEHGVDAQTLLDTLKAGPSLGTQPFVRLEWQRILGGRVPPWVPARHRLISVEKHQLFADSQSARLRRLGLPKLAIELPHIAIGRKKPNKPEWLDIHWKRTLPKGELRVQQTRIFPKAPKWSPVHKWNLPALRYSANRTEWEPRREQQKQKHTQSY